jgi:hypothetical protein
VTAALLLLSVDHSYFAHWHNFVSQARVGMVETTLTFWLMLSMIIAWEAKKRPAIICWIGLTTGLAFMTKSWVGAFAFALPFVDSFITRQVDAQRRYWVMAAALSAVIALPWHLWQLWFYGSAFLHDYVVVNVLGRILGLVQQETRGSFFYFDVIRGGFSFGYAWLLAYGWTLWNVRHRDSQPKCLLLVWVTIPIVLFSLAATKVGWYVILIYPGIALMLAAAAADLAGRRAAAAAFAILMAVLYFRLPVALDGSPDTKQFAHNVHSIVNSHETLYMYTDDECDGPGDLTMYGRRGFWDVPPSLFYYVEHPIVCFQGGAAALTAWPDHAYIIMDTLLPGSSSTFDNVLLREGHYLLGDVSGGTATKMLNRRLSRGPMADRPVP